MKALSFVVGFCRRLLLGFLLLFWVCVGYQVFKRGLDGFLHWYYATVYQSTLIVPEKMEWRPIVIALSVYFAITVVLAVWEWRSLKGRAS